MEICTAFNNRVFLFLCACLSGILFALVWRKYEQTVELSMVYNHYSSSLRSSGYNIWLKKQGYSRKHLSEEDLKFSDKNKYTASESYFLYKSVPVLCLVFVNSHSGAEAVKNTWSKHCNIVTFFGRFVDKKIPVLKVPPLTSFEGFCYAFVHVWKKYMHQFHWVLIADDSTYVLIENLRYYIAPLNSSLHYYLGHAVKDFSSMYNVASAGIVLSHGTLALLYSLYQSATECSTKGAPSWYFDQALGKILETFSVNPVDTRDTHFRGRFNPYTVETMLIPGSISVFSSYWRTSAFLSGEGMDCCSDNAITFHDVSPSKMYLLEYLLHHMAVFSHSPLGLGNKPVTREALPNPKDNEIDGFIVKEFGKPFVQLLDKNWISVKTAKRTSREKGILESLWKDLFGS